jgi:cell division ATPase FtsA
MYWDILQKPLAVKGMKMVIFVGVPKGIASGYVKFCNSIGLEIVSLGVESLSLARAILKKSDRQSLVIDIGTLSTGLNFFDSNDKINMSVSIPQGGESFTDAIETSLKISRDEAEDLKIKFGFSDNTENNIKNIITPVLENILKEVKLAIQYYEDSFKQELDDVYLIGGSSLSLGIAPVVSNYLGKPVQGATNSQNLSLKVLAEKEKQFPLFVNVVGLGMLGASTEFTDINLLKQIPRSEVNKVNELDLFRLGYLSHINVIRTLFNNKYVLVLLIMLVAVIFYFLLLQIDGYGLSSAVLNSLY